MSDDHDEVDWSEIESALGEAGENAKYNMVVLTPAMMLRRILWDMAPCDLAADVVKVLGLEEASQDVEDMEHTESHVRLAQVQKILPLLAAWAQMACQVAVATTLVRHGHEGQITDSMVEETTETLVPVVYQSMVAAIAEGLDMGLLHFPHTVILKDTQ